MVYGVILGAMLHLLIQVPGLIRYQFHWTPALEIKSAGVQRVLILLGPRVLTMGCIQAYFVARDNLASHFGTTGVGALNLGWTIEQVPETIIGTAMAVAILPSLAEFIDRGEIGNFTQTVNRALRIMLALCTPRGCAAGVCSTTTGAELLWIRRDAAGPVTSMHLGVPGGARGRYLAGSGCAVLLREPEHTHATRRGSHPSDSLCSALGRAFTGLRAGGDPALGSTNIHNTSHRAAHHPEPALPRLAGARKHRITSYRRGGGSRDRGMGRATFRTFAEPGEGDDRAVSGRSGSAAVGVARSPAALQSMSQRYNYAHV